MLKVRNHIKLTAIAISHKTPIYPCCLRVNVKKPPLRALLNSKALNIYSAAARTLLSIIFFL